MSASAPALAGSRWGGVVAHLSRSPTLRFILRRLFAAVVIVLGVTFVSHLAVRNRLALGTLKLAYARGLELGRWFSLARTAGPEPKGNVMAFRTLLAVHVPDRCG